MVVYGATLSGVKQTFYWWDFTYNTNNSPLSGLV